MARTSLHFQSHVESAPEKVYAWHDTTATFDRLSPSWGRIRVANARGTIHPGDGKDLRAGIGPFALPWTIIHSAPHQGIGFNDDQTSGPFTSWHHEHEFIPDGGGTRIEDRITYQLPAGSLGNAVAGGSIVGTMDDVFRYRHRVTASDLTYLKRGNSANRPMRIAITGASGTVGMQLSAFLRAGGHVVYPIVRTPRSEDHEIRWNPTTGEIAAAALEGMDAVVHLAGASIAGGRWTKKRKEAILQSRLRGTKLLAETLAGLERPPRVLVSASAVGYYGDAPGIVLTEDAPAGEGFLADVCVAWEDAADAARAAGIRVVHPRLGIVLSGFGGMLPLVARAFNFGVGGPFGNGRQHMSWIALDDLLGIFLEAIVNDTLTGPINAVSPRSITNAEFTKTLARVLRRPAFLTVPKFALHLVSGELAEELLLVDQAAAPRRLEEAGFPFVWADLEETLRFQLGHFGKDQPQFASQVSRDGAPELGPA